MSLLRKTLPYLTVAILLAAIYDGWIFYSRWRDSRDAERAAKVKEVEDARQTIEMMGGGDLKILNFYVTPSAVRSGQPANICYGVYGAKSVRIDPLPEDLRPAVSRCLQVTPTKSTEYKLIAQDHSGKTATRDLVLQVTP